MDLQGASDHPGPPVHIGESPASQVQGERSMNWVLEISYMPMYSTEVSPTYSICGMET